MQQLSDVLPHVARDTTLSRLAELKTNLAQTGVAINETMQRVRTLEKEERSTPSRLVTR